MSIARRIGLSILLLVIVTVSITLGEAWLWLTVVLTAIFFFGLFWPARKSSGER